MAAIVAFAVGSTNAFATAIPIGPGGGIVAIGNTSGTLVGVSSTGGSQIGCINWNTPFNGNASPCSSSTTVPMSVSGGDTADFTIPSTGTIRDIPQNVMLPLTQFESIPSPLGTVFFDLTSIPPAAPPASNDCSSGAVGSVCVPTGSPFRFTQASADQVDVQLVLGMQAYTGTSATGETPYNGLFSTTLSGKLSDGSVVTIPDILNLEFNEHGTITSTWSATESPSPVPEPTTTLLVGVGLLGMALYRRRVSQS
ncbi:MAG TPA: PEP-CTERM sorting domain-containing protein [Bryobacteraceae bacterium]|nr:PEP-CTERM sorting domain-containing protein [Bryobacteraceae bacterium]